MQNLLVTGGAGFIGSNFIRYVLETHPSYGVVNLDKLTYAGNLENLKDVESNPRYHFVKGDIVDQPLVESIVRQHQIDAILNFAAESHVDRSILSVAPFIETNYVGTHVLLEVTRDLSVGKFLQVSTDEVYGSAPPSGKFTEETPLNPSSPYAASKASADLLALSYYRTFGTPVVITRSSNNYGPFQFPEKLIPLMISNAINDIPLPIYGDGLQVRDWLHVRDHCISLDLVLHSGVDGEVYNISAENEKKNLDVVRLILRKLGKPETLIKFVKDRPGHDRRYALNSMKIKRELRWIPQMGFEECLEETIDWYREHQAWWEKIRSGEYREYYRKMYEER
ncbi:MAG: dTDP-glucose 4,6-dehydratase [Bacteroidota bacterium]